MIFQIRHIRDIRHNLNIRGVWRDAFSDSSQEIDENG